MVVFVPNSPPRFQSTPANFTAGDLTISSVLPGDWQFQSTPANFTAGDKMPWIKIINVQLFQSTPANFTAGDLRSGSPFSFALVSIHARQFHSGRHGKIVMFFNR